jgi:hypothetical protein
MRGFWWCSIASACGPCDPSVGRRASDDARASRHGSAPTIKWRREEAAVVRLDVTKPVVLPPWDGGGVRRRRRSSLPAGGDGATPFECSEGEVAARVETTAGAWRHSQSEERGRGCGMAGHQWPVVPIRYWRVKEDRKRKRD